MKKINELSIITLLITSMLTIMVGSAIAPALLEISHNLDFQFESGLLITLPSLGVVLFSPLAGRLLPIIGSFRLLCFGLIPYATFGYVGGFITHSYLLIADRILLGASAVAIQIAATAIIAENFFGRERMKLIAWQGMAIEGGGVIFLSIGGILGQIHWRSPFLIYLIALLCLLLSVIALPRTSAVHDSKENDNTIHEKDKVDRLVYIIFAGALFSMIIFFVSFIQLPQYLPQAFHFSEAQTGYLMSFISLCAVITASQMPLIARKISSGFTVALGFLFFTLGYFLLSTVSIVGLLYVAALVMGIGFGLTIPTLNHMMVEVSSSASRGKNLGLYSLGVFGGQFLATFFGLLIEEPTSLFLVTSALSFIIAVILGALFNKYVSVLGPSFSANKRDETKV